MDLAHAFRIAFQIAIVATVFATGLATTTEDLGYLRRNPGLLLRSFLATLVVAPIVALVLWRMLPIGAPAAIAIIAGALAPGLPTLPRRNTRLGGHVAFATSLMFATSLLGIVTIPIWLAILRRFAGIDVAVSSGAIVRLLALGLLLPLVAGVVFRRLAPKLAERLASPVSTFANALMPGLALVVVLVGGAALLELGWAALLAMVIAPVISLAVGHALGGPAPGDRTVLAVADAARFPALAALIASASFPEVHAIPAVIAYVIVANVVALVYQLARRRAVGDGREERRGEGAVPTVAAPARAS